MKRNLKPFAVEIKKSRVPGQRHHLPAKRLFGTVPSETPKVFQKTEPQAPAEPAAASRILPSLREPAWKGLQSVEPVHRRRSSGSMDRRQIEFDLKTSASEDEEDAPAATPVISEAVSHAEPAPVVEEAATPVPETQPREAQNTRAESRRPRKKEPKTADTVMPAEPVLEPERALEAAVAGPSLPAAARKAVRHRLSKREAVATQLPRHERWKRRLHPSAW